MSDNNLLSSYQQIISSYQAIDNFRAQLLERLPLATGAGGILLLYFSKDGSLSEDTIKFLPFIGLFGFVITVGLFVYEFYGIRKCTALINAGKEAESMLGIDGQFHHRPASFFNEPFAAGLIYPAVLAAWAYIGLAFANSANHSILVSSLVFGIFFSILMGYNLKLFLDSKPTGLRLLNQDILRAEEEGNRDLLDELLHPGFTIMRSTGETQNKGQFLNSVSVNKNRGRLATQSHVQTVGQCAIYTGIVITVQNPNATSNPGRFWNTRLFVKENGRWVCLSWQVMKLP